MENYYTDNFLKENKIDIIDTSEILDKIIKKDNSNFFNVGITLINVKAIRAQTKKVEKQTEALDRNSESSDKLAIKYNNLTKIIILLMFLQIIVAFLPYIENITKYFFN